MSYATISNRQHQKLNFHFQQIVDAHGQKQGWIEMLYRPDSLQGHETVDQFFKSQTQQQKVDLDIAIFSEARHILNNCSAEKISINLNPGSWSDNKFRSHLQHLLQAELIDAKRICIEFTEIEAMPSLCYEGIELLEKIKSQGGWIALDDFGSGFAHWELLQIGLVNVIKVANQNLMGNHINQFIHGLSNLASHLKINSVLEGVETKRDFIHGQQQGFDNFQGWYFN